ncbi:MAG: class I SAM-dependent methyltransferase [Chloroflexi bacterium OHK40]
MRPEHLFPPDAFRRYDEGDDRDFYRYPRLTAHLDEAACAAVTQLLREELPPGGRILDLMSSYVSHLPPEVSYGYVLGLGLNEAELRLNGQLHEWLVHDLNREPALPLPDRSFDGAACTVSVQYLTRPIDVFAEVGRTLRPGAPFVVSFSNRCFPSKAVNIWVSTGDREHLALVRRYFELAGCFTDIRALNRSPHRWLSDPLFAVVARAR